jgi:hypothetical protein
MKAWLLAFALCLSCVGTAGQAQEAPPSDESLIESLIAIDRPVVGVDGMAMYDGFIGDGSSPQFGGGVLGVPPPATTPQMRELVRRGVAALPALIAHLGDARPTKFSVGGGDFYMFRLFQDEYDPRTHTPLQQCAPDCTSGRDFQGSYTVRVADICFALIGQIVGRRLDAVRYQPTQGLVVNSPLETPDLADRVRRDWRDLSPSDFRAFLLAEVAGAHWLWQAAPALTRLRFYYPADYAALRGGGRAWREKFEADAGAAGR